MKKHLSLGMLMLFVGITVLAQQGDVHRVSSADFPDRFVGAWRLAWLEEPDSSGNVHRADCAGLLVYTRDGHMSVQVIYRDPQAAGNVASVQYSQGGYEASFGTYKVEDDHSFTFHVEGALVRTLIGHDLKRIYEFSGDQLIVKSPDPNEHWRVAWKHY